MRLKNRIEKLEETIAKESLGKNWSKIGIGKSKIEGNGVFAIKNIKRDELIEEAPYIVVSKELLQYQNISDYLFMINDEFCAVVFGYGSIYNHSNSPNVRCAIDYSGNKVKYYAKNSIKAGEELTITYGDDWFQERMIQIK